MKLQNSGHRILWLIGFGLIWLLALQVTGLFDLQADRYLASGNTFLGSGIASITQRAGLISKLYQSDDGSQLVLGGNFTLEADETLNGSLVVLGGNAQILEGALLDGDVVVLGGNLIVDGEVSGNVFILAGLGELGSTAWIHGDVTSVSANLKRDDGARIEGEVSENITSPIPLPVPGRPDTPSVVPQATGNQGFSVWEGLFFFFRSFMWAALAILIVLFFPKNTQRVANTVVSSAWVSAGLGILTAMVAPIILVVVAITIIGFPISLLAVILLAMAWAFGLIVIGVETGNRLGRLANQDWALPVSAGIGTFLMTLVVNGIGKVIPCVGWMAPFLVGSIGLGATLLTLFGTRSYPITMPRQPHISAQSYPPPGNIESSGVNRTGLEDLSSQNAPDEGDNTRSE